MEVEAGTASLSGSLAAIACVALALFYVVILYAPTAILRLPPPTSYKQFMIRRFVCAAISTVVSLIFSSLILPTRTWKASELLSVYAIRVDHLWQAIVYPLSLTSLMYAGSLVLKLFLLLDSWTGHMRNGGCFSLSGTCSAIRGIHYQVLCIASNVLSWRTYVVAPLTEEIVFRACMIPLLLCGGFRINSAIFLCPILFSLSHLNHFVEVYARHNYSLLKALMVVGLQLSYTVVFGSYASFLLTRTGHLLAPLVAHIFCNIMGLPVISSRRAGLVSLASVVGFVSFLLLLFPATQPILYNTQTGSCHCWHGYCSWD